MRKEDKEMCVWYNVARTNLKKRPKDMKPTDSDYYMRRGCYSCEGLDKLCKCYANGK